MPRIDADELESFAQSIVTALGSPPDIAATVAEALVAADLRGHGSHGTRRLATLYPRMVDAGNIDPSAEPTEESADGPLVTISGNFAWGHVTGRRGVDAGLSLADEHGVGVVGIRDGAHMGRIGEYAERAAERDCILVAFVNTGGVAPMAAAPGTTNRNISVNPYVAGIPSFGAVPFPVVLDIATGQVAHGKIMKRALAGQALPDEWALDDAGDPLHDAEAFEDGVGAVLPLGGRPFGYKGAGISLTVELIAGLVGGGAVHGMDIDRIVNNGAAFVVIDPLRFLSAERCRERVSALAAHLRDQDYDPGLVGGTATTSDHALLPGEPEYETRLDRESNGIPLDAGAIENLVAVADEYGVVDRPPGFD